MRGLVPRAYKGGDDALVHFVINVDGR